MSNQMTKKKVCVGECVAVCVRACVCVCGWMGGVRCSEVHSFIFYSLVIFKTIPAVNGRGRGSLQTVLRSIQVSERCSDCEAKSWDKILNSVDVDKHPETDFSLRDVRFVGVYFTIYTLAQNSITKYYHLSFVMIRFFNIALQVTWTVSAWLTLVFPQTYTGIVRRDTLNTGFIFTYIS